MRLKHLLLSCLLLMVAREAFAFDYKDNITGIYYNLDTTDKTASVTYGESLYSPSYSGEVTIPEEIKYEGDTYAVTSIGENAFSGCRELTSVTIGNGVKSIGKFAFSNCSTLKELTIGNNVTSIETNAFAYCSQLADIILPNSVMSIGESAFSNCSALTMLTIPNSVTSIGKYAFSSCSHLTELIIEYGITSIAECVFQDCRALTKMVIPNSVTTISESAFSNCSALSEFTIPNSVTYIGGTAFYGCHGLTELTIPNNVITIGNMAFGSCNGLIELTIGTGVTNIGKDAETNAFVGCYNLAKIVVEEGNAFYDSREDCNAIIRKSDNKLIVGCEKSHIPNSVASIGNRAFSSCYGLTEITIPNSVTSIGEWAFVACDKLTEIVIPNSVTSIDGCVFYNCTNLKKVTLSNSITSIPSSTFAYCRALTEIVLPNTITSIGERAFIDCGSLKEIIIPNNVVTIGDYAFQNCSSMIELKIGNSVTSIGRSAFYYCKSLEKIICSRIESVPNIGNDIFYNTNNAPIIVPAELVYGYKAEWSDYEDRIISYDTVEIGETGYATYCSNADLQFSDDMSIKAYIVTGYEGEEVKVTRVYDVPAGTGIILIGEEGNTHTYDMPFVLTEATIDDNLLIGTLTEQELPRITVDGKSNYILGRKGNEVGFFQPKEGAIIGAHKAYLQLDGINATALRIGGFDNTTGIEQTIQQPAPQTDAIYNLNGQRVSNPQHGIYIVNGKKKLF